MKGNRLDQLIFMERGHGWSSRRFPSNAIIHFNIFAVSLHYFCAWKLFVWFAPTNLFSSFVRFNTLLFRVLIKSARWLKQSLRDFKLIDSDRALVGFVTYTMASVGLVPSVGSAGSGRLSCAVSDDSDADSALSESPSRIEPDRCIIKLTTARGRPWLGSWVTSLRAGPRRPPGRRRRERARCRGSRDMIPSGRGLNQKSPCFSRCCLAAIMMQRGYRRRLFRAGAIEIYLFRVFLSFFLSVLIVLIVPNYSNYSSLFK